MINWKNIIIIIVIVAILLCFVPFLYPSLTLFDQGSISHVEKKEKAHEEYGTLFNRTIYKNFKSQSDFTSKSKHTFSSFIYRVNYALNIYKVNLTSKFTPALIKVIPEKVQLTSGSSYIGYDETNYLECRFSLSSDSIVDDFILKYCGDIPEKRCYGDSIVDYNLSCTELSIGNSKELNEIAYFGAQKNVFEKIKPKISFNVAFYKRTEFVYIIILYARNWNVNTDSKMMERILKI